MRNFVWLLFLALSLAACGKQQERLPLSWKPSDVHVACPSGQCPAGTGLLMFVKKQKSDMSVIHCTGTLISNNSLLTNSHCDFVNQPGLQGYFFVPTAQGTVYSEVNGDLFRVKGQTSGLDRDLAILTLAHAMPVQPRRIARKIPARMDSLVGFVANRYAMNVYNLDKQACKTIPKMALYGGGVNDQHTGLALFDCDIKKGNSGAAMFLPDQLEDIQVVVNTIWKFTNGMDDFNIVESLFFDLPNYFKTGYAMGERVHCQDVKGWPEPETNCLRVNYERTLDDPFRTAITAEILNRLPKQNTGDIVWTTEVFAVRTAPFLTGYSQPVVILAPKPYCYRKGKNSTQDLTFSYLKLGLYPDGHAGTHLIAEDRMQVRSTQSASGNLKLVYTRDPSASAEIFIFPAGERDRFTSLGSPANVRRLFYCGNNAESEAASLALQNLSKIRVPSPAREVSL